MRNYEAAGVLPAAGRTASGYRVYTERHAGALAAFLALVPAYGYPAARTVMWAVHRGDLDAAFQAIDAGHAQLTRDRQTLDAVESAVGLLLDRPPADRPDRPLPVGAVAHRLGVTAAALRKWERAGILTPQRDRAGYRVYRVADVRDAELAHLLRRGGYPLAHIATVVRHVQEAGGAEPLAASLADWRRRLTARGRAMLTAAARLDTYLAAEPPAGDPGAEKPGRGSAA
ncbi:MerR family transcriptional regulator [Paractinoplanes rishiriensis]|uniref:MerR family transcriptional regulator n=1 Tax=Paractinoplanes rishiriensis TaxID=1050105 RepID=A0A919JQ89_9ACTN|nr:MerR family transcriptional regulator [Actinoplanes rishiriensis]